MPKPDLHVVAGRPVAEHEYAEAHGPIDVKERRRVGVGFFEAAVAFIALSFVALLFALAAAVVILNLERLP